jgi:hypothetical protein
MDSVRTLAQLIRIQEITVRLSARRPAIITEMFVAFKPCRQELES